MSDNSLGSLSSTVIAQNALSQVFHLRPMLRNISTDFSDEALAFNQSLKTRIVSPLAVQDFDDDPQAANTSDVTVTLNQFKKIHLAWTPQEISGSHRNFVTEQSNAIATALADSLIAEVAALWTASYFPNATTKASGWTYADPLIKLRSALNLRGVPQERRFAVFNTPVMESLLTDSDLIDASVNASSNQAIKRGVVPPNAGFETISEYPDLPTTGNMVGFAGAPDSCVIVSRIPRDAATLVSGGQFPGTYETITDPDSGLSALLNVWTNPDTLVLNYRVCWMFGCAVGNPDSGQRLITAP